MAYTERPVTAMNPWLVRREPRQVKGITVHSTRSGISDGDDGPRTERWMGNAVNVSGSGTWGSSCDVIIFEDGTRVICTDFDNEWPSYGAGYGGTITGTFPLSKYHLQVEMAQGVPSDIFTDDQYRSFSEFAYGVAARFGFPLIYLPFVDQSLLDPVPCGISRHDLCANGHRLGKSDPGAMWSETRSILSLTPAPNETVVRLTELERRVGDLERDALKRGDSATLT